MFQIFDRNKRIFFKTSHYYKMMAFHHNVNVNLVVLNYIIFMNK